MKLYLDYLLTCSVLVPFLMPVEVFQLLDLHCGLFCLSSHLTVGLLCGIPSKHHLMQQEEHSQASSPHVPPQQLVRCLPLLLS